MDDYHDDDRKPDGASGGPKTVRACRDCESSDVFQTTAGEWRCKDCGAAGFAPIERPERLGGSPIADALVRADPDDLDELLTDGGTVPVCRECESGRIEPRAGGPHRRTVPADDAGWRCNECGETFDEPERTASDWTPRKAGPAALDRADPDDVLPDGGTVEDDEEWRPNCYDCGREVARRNLQPHPVHIEHEDGSGYDVVDVPLCPVCRKQRMPTHACQTCGEEYVHLDRAAECCQHRVGRPMPDGGLEIVVVEAINLDDEAIALGLPAGELDRYEIPDDQIIDEDDERWRPAFADLGDGETVPLKPEVATDGGVDVDVDASLVRIRDYVQDGRRAEAVGEIDRLRTLLPDGGDGDATI